MNGPLADLGRDLYEQLTARTLHVVDTEFATHTGQHHLISIAVVPVVGGRRTRAGGQLYREMNPGVPIDPGTRAVHGFTDADVAGKPPFAHYARVIAERLREPDAVFVCHNTIDAHVLRREYERLDERTAAGEPGITAGLADLPDLPVLDTQRLAHAVSYPGATRGTRLSLDALCDLTGVPRPRTAHDARADARATADALIALLRHAAGTAAFWTFADLLDAAGGGTTHDPKGPAHIRTRRSRGPDLPAEHVARHIHPLTDPVPAGSPQAEQWLDLAAECAALRCPHLRDEAAVAAPHNGAILLRPLMDDLPHLTEPGQAGTLLGAVHALLTTPPAADAEPTLPVRRALRWWQAARPAIQASTPCDRTAQATSCPACRDGDPCPRDIIHLPVAETVALGSGGQMTDTRVRRLLTPARKAAWNRWRKHHPDILAHALWLAARHQFDQGHDEAAYDTVDHGIALGVHTLDPRLAELACERLVENGNPTAAFTDAQTALDQATTDPAYADLADWVQFTRNALYAQQPPPRRTITQPRRARPDGHTNPRLYS